MSGYRDRRPRSGVLFRREGFILIAVLWLMVALSAVGLNAALQLRTERVAAANLLDQARGRDAAIAGAEYARSRLSSAILEGAEELRADAAAQERRNRGTGGNQNVQGLFGNTEFAADSWREPQELVVSQMSLGDAIFTLRLRDTGAALNLNSADEEMLRNFFSQGLDLDYAQADRITQAILDWRDEDDLPRTGGAERAEYIEAGAAILPSNRLFTHLDELRQVLGMTPEIHAAAMPHLILISSGRINVNAASEEVLLGLPGMTPTAAMEIVNLRASGTFADDVDSLLRSLSAGSAAPLRAAGRRFNQRLGFRSTEVEILSEGRMEGSPISSRLRVILTRTGLGAAILSREFD